MNNYKYRIELVADYIYKLELADEIKSYFKNRTILVTGGAGSIGSNLVIALSNLVGDDGKTRWLKEITPMAEALRKRQVSQESVYVMTLSGNEQRVAEIAKQILFG